MALLALLVIPQVGKYTKKGEKSYYESLASELIVMAKNYYTDNKNELPRGQLSEDGHPTIYKVLTIDELKEGNYITNDIVDTKNNSCEASYVTVENNNGQFEYNACLICNGEAVYGEDCSFGGIKDNSIPECTVQLNNYTVGNWTNKAVTATITGTDESGIYSFASDGKKSIAENNMGTIKFNKSGNYTIKVYDKAGNAGTCTTGQINIETVKPTCSMEVINTTTRTKTIEIKIQDESPSSGISTASIKDTKNVTTNLTITNNKTTFDATKNGTYVATVTDIAGNDNTCSIPITGLDSEPPVVVLTVSNSAVGSAKINGKITDNVEIVGYKWTTTNEEPTSWTSITPTTEITVSDPKNDVGTYYLWAYDGTNAGKQSVDLGYGSWNDYTTTACTASSFCGTQTQYRTYGCVPSGCSYGQLDRSDCGSPAGHICSYGGDFVEGWCNYGRYVCRTVGCSDHYYYTCCSSYCSWSAWTTTACSGNNCQTRTVYRTRNLVQA